VNGYKNALTPNYYPKTATLYSAVLEDGDYHSKKDRFTSFFLSLFTPFPEKMQINRAFGKAMYQYYAREKFTNIFDIGAGPMPRGHEWAPGANFLYVDHNPAIVEHARKKLRDSDKAIYETGGVGDIPRLFEAGLGERAFGGDRKIAIGSNAVLMFVPDDQIRDAFTYLYHWAAVGSAVTITMTGVTSAENALGAKMIRGFFRWIDAPMYIRNIDTFASLLSPWTMIKGPMPTWQWLGAPPSKQTAGVGFDLYAMRLEKKRSHRRAGA
jgi:S-adenosyl methyltransferase